MPLLSGVESGESEARSDFFALGPVVVGVALEAAGFGVVGAGSVAGLAGGDAGNENVAGFGAGERFSVAACAGEAGVGVVAEFGMRQPALRGVGGRDGGNWNFRNLRARGTHLLSGASDDGCGPAGDTCVRKRIAIHLMALDARLVREKLFGNG